MKTFDCFFPVMLVSLEYINVRKTFKYRLYPTKAQISSLEANLRECRWLYNHLLEQRKTAYETHGTSLGRYTQVNTIPALKQERESLKCVHSQVLQNVAVRLDLAMQAFYRRVTARCAAHRTVKAGENAQRAPGYPRFQGRDRYDSLTFPQAPVGCKLEGSTLSISKIGQIKVLVHRPMEGRVKTCTLKCDSCGKRCPLRSSTGAMRKTWAKFSAR